jgi:hypothetical protein
MVKTVLFVYLNGITVPEIRQFRWDNICNLYTYIGVTINYRSYDDGQSETDT